MTPMGLWAMRLKQWQPSPVRRRLLKTEGTIEEDWEN
jgi:hypothetical protein